MCFGTPRHRRTGIRLRRVRSRSAVGTDVADRRLERLLHPRVERADDLRHAVLPTLIRLGDGRRPDDRRAGIVGEKLERPALAGLRALLTMVRTGAHAMAVATSIGRQGG